MPGRLKNSAKKTTSRKSIARPFDPALLERARAIADRYQIIVWREDGEYFGRGLELPLTMNDGRTADECVANVHESLVTTVAYLLEKGEAPPAPASEKQRSEQVNVRLTVEEKLLIEEAARCRGYRGVSDFIRAAALSSSGRM